VCVPANLGPSVLFCMPYRTDCVLLWDDIRALLRPASISESYPIRCALGRLWDAENPQPHPPATAIPACLLSV
jgi:hypothetical protein